MVHSTSPFPLSDHTPIQFITLWSSSPHSKLRHFTPSLIPYSTTLRFTVMSTAHYFISFLTSTSHSPPSCFNSSPLHWIPLYSIPLHFALNYSTLLFRPLASLFHLTILTTLHHFITVRRTPVHSTLLHTIPLNSTQLGSSARQSTPFYFTLCLLISPASLLSILRNVVSTS